MEIFFRTDEIGELSDQLTELLDGRARQVSTRHIEQMFGLTIEPDGDGFLVEFWIDDHQGWSPSIKGSRATRASLESFRSQVNEATGEFPVRGEPL